MLLRPAAPEDALAVARVHVRSWQAGYRGLIADAQLDALRPEDRAARYTFGSTDAQASYTTVAEDAGAILGFVTTRPGELFGLYVDPDAWGRGVGRALLAAGYARMGLGPVSLWMLEGNTRAERFYLADGWERDGERRETELWGIRMPIVKLVRTLP